MGYEFVQSDPDGLFVLEDVRRIPPGPQKEKEK
jgi:hypothetical protein